MFSMAPTSFSISSCFGELIFTGTDFGDLLVAVECEGLLDLRAFHCPAVLRQQKFLTTDFHALGFLAEVDDAFGAVAETRALDGVVGRDELVRDQFGGRHDLVEFAGVAIRPQEHGAVFEP